MEINLPPKTIGEKIVDAEREGNLIFLQNMIEEKN